MSTLFDLLAKTLSGREWDRAILELLKHLFTGGTVGNLATNGTAEYFPAVGVLAPTVTEANTQQTVPQSGIVKNASIKLTVAPGASKTRVFKLRKNGADTAIVVTITGGTATLGTDTTNEVSVAAGDLLAWWSDGGAATTPAASQAKASVEYHLR